MYFSAPGHKSTLRKIDVVPNAEYEVCVSLAGSTATGPGNIEVWGLATLSNAYTPPTVAGLKAPRVRRSQPLAGPDPEYQFARPDAIIVVPRPGSKHAAAAADVNAAGARVVRSSPLSGYILVSIPEGRSAEEFAQELGRLPWVDTAYPDNVVWALGGPVEPNDPGYTQQWHYRAISLPQAWGVTVGFERPVTVAVIDTGVRPEHPDLQGRLDLANARDFVDNDYDPTDEPSAGRASHGTHVAGTIGAATSNGIGVAGVSWGATILPIRVLRPDGSGSESLVADGINWAISRGASVINLSLGQPSFPPLGSVGNTALERAESQGIVVVAAAGNTGTSGVWWPAAHPTTIAVGAVGRQLQKASYSTTGPELDVAAPGGACGNDQFPGTGDPEDRIFSTYYMPGDSAQYGYMQGTSMATPHVSGVVALMLSKLGPMAPAEVRDLIQMTSMDDPGVPGWDPDYGHGIVNAYAAVTASTMDRAIFALVDEEGELQSAADYGGRDRSFSVPCALPGVHSLFGWLDVNENGVVDDGDYVGLQRGVEVTSPGPLFVPLFKLRYFNNLWPTEDLQLISKIDVAALLAGSNARVRVRRIR
jgi:subtilisin family serine protease